MALHETPAEHGPEQAVNGPLDHFGFIAKTTDAVNDWAKWAEENGVRILKNPKQHRDGSYSCYLADPDGNTIQILYEPTISGSV